MKKKTLIPILLLVVIGGAYLFLQRDKTETPESTPEFAEAKRGPLVISVKESGFLNAKEEITIKNQIPASNITILDLVPDGSFVKKGDFLVELDSTSLEEKKKKIEDSILSQELSLNESKNNLEITKSEIESRTSEAESAIYFAGLDLEKFITLDRQKQIDAQESSIEESKDQLNLSQQTYNASKTLVERGFETTGKLEQDRLSLASRQKQLNALEAQLKILIQYDLLKSEKKFENVLEETKNKHARMIKEGEVKIQKAVAQVTNSEQKLEGYRESLTEILEHISLTKLTSEVEGYALYPRSKYSSSDTIEIGKSVSRDKTLMRIPIMNDMKVDVEIAEHFISDLEIGQKTVITIDSLKDQVFDGTVSKIALLPIQNKSWLGATVQKYEVEIDVDDAMLPDNVKPQISASAEIILDKISDALSVPIQSIHTVKGKQIVYVREGIGNDYSEREVRIGKMETNFIEIIKGLSEGEEVLISEPQI